MSYFPALSFRTESYGSSQEFQTPRREERKGEREREKKKENNRQAERVRARDFHERP